MGPIISTNDSTHMPPPWSLEGPSHPEEEGRLINISLGYEILPLCMSQTKLCINVSTNMGFHPASKKELPHIAWTVYCPVLYKNHVNTTCQYIQKLECKGFTYKDFRYTPVY